MSRAEAADHEKTHISGTKDCRSTEAVRAAMMMAMHA
jgi:hypothetical protein